MFPSRMFDRLEALSGDAGARSLLRQSPWQVALVPWPQGAADIDEPADIASCGGLVADESERPEKGAARCLLSVGADRQQVEQPRKSNHGRARQKGDIR